MKKNIEDLFTHLNDASVEYVVWKDTQNVNLFFEGNNELDILVSKKDREKFKEALKLYDFSELEVNRLLDKENINHYIKFCDGSFFHIHVYFELNTGNHYVKEYKLKLLDDFFKSPLFIHNVKVVNEKMEISILFIRLALKNSFLVTKIKEEEVRRVIELFKVIDLECIAVNINKFINNSFYDSQKVNKFIVNNKLVYSELNKLKKMFKQDKYISNAMFYFNYIKMRSCLLYLRIKRSSNKTLLDKGIMISILGTDGSGKSTVVNELFRCFKAKTSTTVIYLGGNNRTYSLKTRLCYYVYYLCRVFSPLKNKSYLSWFMYYLGLSLLEYGKAIDREKRIQNGYELFKKGWIVIFERYPMAGLFDFPNNLSNCQNEIWEKKLGNKLIKHLFEKIRTKIMNLKKPSLMFMLFVELEQIQNRRNLTENEKIDIENKFELLSQYLEKPSDDLYVLNNDGVIDNVLFEITNKVNKELCTFN